MKYILFVLVLFSVSFQALADVWVEGHYRDNGTYVKGHWRSSPNDTKADNWSTRGNINPHTGKVGTRTYADYNNYGSSGSRGYYNNEYDNYHDFDSTGYELPGHYGENGDFYHDDGNIYNPYITVEENDSEWVGKWRTEVSPKVLNRTNQATDSKSSDKEGWTLGLMALAAFLVLAVWAAIARSLGYIQYFLFSDESLKKADYFSKFGMTVATIVISWVFFLKFLS